MEINLLRNTTCSIADIEQSNILCLGGGFSKVQVGFLLMWPFAVNWELEAFSAHFSLLLLLRPSCQHSYVARSGKPLVGDARTTAEASIEARSRDLKLECRFLFSFPLLFPAVVQFAVK